MLEKGASYMTDAMKQHWFQVMEECATNAISDDVDTSEVQIASSSNSTSQSTSSSSSSSMSMANTVSRAPTSKNTYTVTNTQYRANHANPTTYNTSSRSTPSSVDRYTHTSARNTVPESNSVSRLTPSDTQRDTQSSTVHRTAPPRTITESNSVSRLTPSDTQRETQSSTVHRTAPSRIITESNSVSRPTPSDTQRDIQSSIHPNAVLSDTVAVNNNTDAEINYEDLLAPDSDDNKCEKFRNEGKVRAVSARHWDTVTDNASDNEVATGKKKGRKGALVRASPLPDSSLVAVTDEEVLEFLRGGGIGLRVSPRRGRSETHTAIEHAALEKQIHSKPTSRRGNNKK
jgi:trimeric autotransporter adhesin